VAKDYDYLIEKLKELNEEFVVYGIKNRKDEENLKFKKPETFLQDLAECKAIISTAGFTLTSEAIYLKKPLFAVPLRRHYEQYFNAKYVRENGFGDFSEKPTSEELMNFLGRLDDYADSFEGVNFDSEISLKEIANTLEIFKNKRFEGF
jgi:uncharacterized protein (TIGR00661 family)